MKIKIKKEIEVDIKYLSVSAGVRYWEDAHVDGIEDTDGNRIPCRVGNRWCPIINVSTGKIINWITGVKSYIHYKVCDDGIYTLNDGNEDILKIEGYVPSCLCPAEDGFGDYIIMEVLEDGTIKDWNFTLDGLLEED